MNPVDYLLTGFATLTVIACCILFVAIRHAVEGYEDDFGFHLGITPAILALNPATALSTYLPADLARASVPAAPKRRRKAGSKPPMLPANLDVSDLNPRAASQPTTNQAEATKENRSAKKTEQ